MATSRSATEGGTGFSLVLRLHDPRRLVELMQDIAKAQERLDEALGALAYVHFARFLPVWDKGLLLIVTEFDGAARDYVMDFAALLAPEFSLILSFMENPPRLPINRYPEDFWNYVSRNSRPLEEALPPYPPIFSPYPDKTVLEILGAAHPKRLPSRTPASASTPALDDIQINLLKGFRAGHALHVGLRFDHPVRGRRLIGALMAHPELAVRAMADWRPGDRHCVNLGLSFEGLQALGVAPSALWSFPAAFRAGPAARAPEMGDTGDAAPATWRIGAPDPSGSTGVHAMVSLYVKGLAEAGRAALERLHAALRDILAAHGVHVVFDHRADALDGRGGVHFGYRDGIAQPNVPGVHAPSGAHDQPFSEVGDFVLGPDHVDSRGGHPMGELPPELAQNGSYAVVRVIEQFVDRFEATLQRAAAEGHEPELVAAKLMGRWRNGASLAQWPDRPDPAAVHAPDEALDAFDYAGPNADFDDPHGQRCPIGAHARRMNPRSGMVLGVPWGRRVIRRGMPYTIEVDTPDGPRPERGLFGIFFCADIEAQYEFLARVWGNGDVSAFGLRGTVDPLIGARQGPTPFRFHVPDDPRPHQISVPPLTRTRGALYLFMPGLAALRSLADRPPSAGASPVVRVEVADLDVADAAFRIDPYAAYARLRHAHPVAQVVSHQDRIWVLRRDLVEAANADPAVFAKPGAGREPAPRPFGITDVLGDGLFYMDPPRHTAVRGMLDDDVGDIFARVDAHARSVAERLLAPFARRRSLEWVASLAAPLPMQVFMDAMGVPTGDQAGVDGWIRAALRAHDPRCAIADRVAGATATMALLTYFRALSRERPVAETPWGTSTLVAAMGRRIGCPVAAQALDADEVMNSAVNLALGGYLSTQFLLTTGVHHLLRQPGQWAALKADRSLLPGAFQEMLRFDAPFQMADRWVTRDTVLGDTLIRAKSRVVLVYGSANRDDAGRGPEEAPLDVFDIRRNASTPNFGFGSANHVCIGAALAMRVTCAGLSALMDALPSARVGEAGSWFTDPYFRSLDKLTLLFD